MSNTRLKLFFPPQKATANQISRSIRQSKIFKEFVVKRSRDMRYLILDFKTEQKKEILTALLNNAMLKSEYEYEIIEE